MNDKAIYDELAQASKRAYRLPELAARIGRAESELLAAAERHEAWRTLDPDARGDMPDDALMAFNGKDGWLVPTPGAQRYVDPARYATDQAVRQAIHKQAARDRAEALDAPAVVALACAEITRLLPGVTVKVEPCDGPEYDWILPHRFAVSLVDAGKMLVGTWAYTVGVALPHLVDLAAIERLRRDLAAAGWSVSGDVHMTHGVFTTAPDGTYWYLDLEVNEADNDSFGRHDRGPVGAASVAWDYGAQAAGIVPAALLTDADAMATFLADLSAPGLMSATQVADVAARRARWTASRP